MPTLNAQSTLTELKTAIAASTELDVTCLKILKGYPPTALTGTNEATLASMSFADGELLTVEESSADHKSHHQTTENKPENSQKVSAEILQSTSNQFKFFNPTKKYGVLINGKLMESGHSYASNASPKTRIRVQLTLICVVVSFAFV